MASGLKQWLFRRNIFEKLWLRHNPKWSTNPIAVMGHLYYCYGPHYGDGSNAYHGAQSYIDFSHFFIFRHTRKRIKFLWRYLKNRIKSHHYRICKSSALSSNYFSNYARHQIKYCTTGWHPFWCIILISMQLSFDEKC